MKTIRKLVYREVIGSVVFVALAFLSLFFFIDFLDELARIGKQGYTTGQAALTALLAVPGRLYELSPIAVLIGTIYAMARLAQSSEFTILRTGGLGPGRALGLLLGLGVAFGAGTFVVGEYLAPLSEQQAARLRAVAKGGASLGRTGAWLKEHRQTPEGARSFSINVASTDSKGQMMGIRIYEHDERGQLVSRLDAKSGRVGSSEQSGGWLLSDVDLTRWPGAVGGDSKQALRLEHQKFEALHWLTTLDDSLVAAATSPIGGMSTFELWRYGRHLTDQEQTSQRYDLQFWKRAFYPFACIVMVALALPFAYLHARAGGVSLKVFGGIMLGISFILLNNVVGHLGLLNAWTPWLAASVPSLLYLGMSLAAFGWLVRYR